MGQGAKHTISHVSILLSIPYTISDFTTFPDIILCGWQGSNKAPTN